MDLKIANIDAFKKASGKINLLVNDYMKNSEYIPLEIQQLLGAFKKAPGTVNLQLNDYMKKSEYIPLEIGRFKKKLSAHKAPKNERNVHEHSARFWALSGRSVF